VPKGKSHGPSIKDDRLYEELREDGASKEKAARIANAAAKEGRSKVARRGGRSEPYEEWNVEELRKKAADVGIEGRSKMTKSDLVSALRSH
jgi:Rho termination factor, N-terminal domain